MSATTTKSRSKFVSIRVSPKTAKRWKKAALDAGVYLQEFVEDAVDQKIRRSR